MTTLLSEHIKATGIDKLWGDGDKEKEASQILIGKQNGGGREETHDPGKQSENVPSVRILLANLPRRRQLKSQLWLRRIWLGITSVSVCE